jgi:predicted RNase H-like HicB family nuclease
MGRSAAESEELPARVRITGPAAARMPLSRTAFQRRRLALFEAEETGSSAAGYPGNVTAIYTARYTKIDAGYVGQLVEWPEVISEGATLEECRENLEDALREMILAYRQQGAAIPMERSLLEPMPVEV